MEETNRKMEATYHDPSLRDGTYDVSFELTEDAEDALFAAFTDELHSHLRDGTFPAQKIHLFQKLSEQRTEHPPWIDTPSGAWTYDLELSEWEYHLISRVVGNSLDNILGPGGADKYEELIDAWKEITQDMQSEQELEELEGEMQQSEIEDYKDFGAPVNSVFKCFVHDGQYRMYEETTTGDKWYICTDCTASFSEIDEEHECPER